MRLPGGGPPVGRGLVVVDPDGWSLRELPGAPAPARPIDVGFTPW
jgi:hypothetical protein